MVHERQKFDRSIGFCFLQKVIGNRSCLVSNEMRRVWSQMKSFVKRYCAHSKKFDRTIGFCFSHKIIRNASFLVSNKISKVLLSSKAKNLTGHSAFVFCIMLGRKIGVSSVYEHLQEHFRVS